MKTMKKSFALVAYLMIVGLWGLAITAMLDVLLGVSWAVLAMAALTQDRTTQKKQTGLKAYKVKAATKIFAGAMVAIDATGFAVPADDADGLRVVGAAYQQADNSLGADGAIMVLVEAPIIALFNAVSITQAMVGQVMYVVDDNTFDDALGTNAIKAGRLVEFVSATSGWIEIEPTGPGVTLADADATYGQPEADLINALKAAVNQRLLS